MSSFSTAAEVLRMLAGSDEQTVLEGAADPIRFILSTGADACEQVTSANEARDAALELVIELRGLLVRCVEVLDSYPPPSEGGAWRIFTLTEEVRRALGRAEQE
jgi:hypothetical protein